MRKLFLTAVTIFLCGIAFSQIYVPITPTTYGEKANRIKVLKAFHPPEKSILETNTDDTTAQIFYYKADSSFWGWSQSKGFFKLSGGAGTGGADSTFFDGNILCGYTAGVPTCVDFRLLIATMGLNYNGKWVIGYNLYHNPIDSFDLHRVDLFAKWPIRITDTLTGEKLASISQGFLDSLSGGGGSQTMQQVFGVEHNRSILTDDDTLDLVANNLNIAGTSGNYVAILNNGTNSGGFAVNANLWSVGTQSLTGDGKGESINGNKDSIRIVSQSGISDQMNLVLKADSFSIHSANLRILKIDRETGQFLMPPYNGTDFSFFDGSAVTGAGWDADGHLVQTDAIHQGVLNVFGEWVDNTDPLNPVINISGDHTMGADGAIHTASHNLEVTNDQVSSLLSINSIPGSERSYIGARSSGPDGQNSFITAYSNPTDGYRAIVHAEDDVHAVSLIANAANQTVTIGGAKLILSTVPDGSADTYILTHNISTNTVGKVLASSVYFPLSGGSITGTGGLGYIGLIPQSSPPSTPVSGVRLYARSTGGFSWIGTNGFTRTLLGTNLTADHAWQFQNKDYTIADSADAQWIRNGSVLKAKNNSDTVTVGTIPNNLDSTGADSEAASNLRIGGRVTVYSQGDQLTLTDTSQYVIGSGQKLAGTIQLNSRLPRGAFGNACAWRWYIADTTSTGINLQGRMVGTSHQADGGNGFPIQFLGKQIMFGNGTTSTAFSTAYATVNGNNKGTANADPFLIRDVANAYIYQRTFSLTGHTAFGTGTDNTVGRVQVHGKLTIDTLANGSTSDSVLVVVNSEIKKVSQASIASGVTFSTGLTNTSGTITDNLATGISGGQSVIGSTSTNSGLTIKSTTGVGATGADIILVSGTNGATELARFLNDGTVGIGTSTVTSSFLHVKKNQNSNTTIRVENGTANSAAQADFRAYNSGGDFFSAGIYSSSTSTYGAFTARTAINYTSSPSGLALMADNATGNIRFATGGNAEKWRISSSGLLSNTAADGTAYLTLKAPTPTASTGQIKLTPGLIQTVAVDGSLNYDTTGGLHNLVFDVLSTGVAVAHYTIAKTLTSTATLDFGSTTAGTATDLTITVTGAALGDVCEIGVPDGSTLADGSFSSWVSASNTVKIRFTNNSLTLALDPASGTFRATVIKY